jgi:hypothetical protein
MLKLKKKIKTNQKNIKGTSKTLAKFIAACASPSLLPPSPKYVITHKPFWALLYA